MRKLASVQKVAAVTPIEGADRIELVHVLGWQCVAAKDEFKVGDLAVYFEVDSFLPIREEFEFLRKNSYKKTDFMGEGFRLKTMRMRGQLSQGLCMPVSKLPELKYLDLVDGMDLTEILGVREWDEPERVGSEGTIKSGRPTYIPKTDETRVQSIPALIDEFKDVPYYITTKMDGSSHSIGIENGEVTYTSHNCTIIDDGKSAFVNYVKEQGIVDKMLAFYEFSKLDSIVLQGEWCGAGIQSNRLKLTKPEWFVFTLMTNGARWGLNITEQVCQEIGAKMVPVEEVGDNLFDKYPDMDALLKRAEGIGYNGTTKEGIVIRPQVPIRSKILQAPLSMKVLNNEYLLKNDG